MRSGIFKYLYALSALFVLPSCAGLDTSSWPRLDQGFELRADPADMPQEEVKTQGVESEASTSGQITEDIVAQQKEIAEQLAKYKEAIAQINGAEKADKERYWFSAQLELSRLNALIDALGSNNYDVLDEYLNGLKDHVFQAKQDLQNLKPN